MGRLIFPWGFGGSEAGAPTFEIVREHTDRV